MLSQEGGVEFIDDDLKMGVWMDWMITYHTTQKMKFSIKGFFSKCDQIRSFLRIWSYLLKKSLTENFILRAVLRFG